MAKIKIHFKGEVYEVEESTLASSFATLTQTLTTLSGGAVTPDIPDEPVVPPSTETKQLSVDFYDFNSEEWDAVIITYIEGETWGEAIARDPDNYIIGDDGRIYLNRYGYHPNNINFDEYGSKPLCFYSMDEYYPEAFVYPLATDIINITSLNCAFYVE